MLSCISLFSVVLRKVHVNAEYCYQLKIFSQLIEYLFRV